MPRWMRRYLSHYDLKTHLGIALALGFVLRLLSAYFVYGPQALDDYNHGVYPAYQYFSDLPLDLPMYRSHLLVWLLASFLRVGSWVGLTTALAQVRMMYAGLATLSLIAIVGTYIFVRDQRSKLFGGLALYLMALFPLMPFLSTRAFGESVATSLIVFGFALLESARTHRERYKFLPMLVGFLFLGAATLFRFHVGLLFLSYGLILLGLRCWPGVLAGLVAGFATIGAEYWVDRLSGKPGFATLIDYLAANEGGAAGYGVSPWYNTWLLILLISLAPFSFVFARKLPQLFRRHWPWLVPFLVYVTAHSLVPHKEERFMYPIVGLELWALAWVWASSALSKPARLIYTNAAFAISVPLLLIFCLVNTQEGEIEPTAYSESEFGKVLYLDASSLIRQSRYHFYFVRPPSLVEVVEPEALNLTRVEQGFVAHPELNAVVMLTSLPELKNQLESLAGGHTASSRCRQVREAGSIIDRVIFALNPKHNARRRPTWYLICSRPGAEQP